MYEQTIRVLLVDDDSTEVDLAQRALAAIANPRFVVESVATLAQAIERASSQVFDVVLLDLELPDSRREDTLVRFRKECGDELSVVALTGGFDECLVTDILGGGAHDYIAKDELNPEVMLHSVRSALLRQQLSRQGNTTNILLEEKNRHLVQLCDTAQEFVENVSHEFRTPLTVIREFTTIIRDGLDGPVTAKQTEHLNRVLHRTDDLALMIDDMLDVSKLEAGWLGVRRNKCRAKDLIENVVGLLKDRATLKNVTLSANVSDNLPSIFCDEEKARRVIINLAVNAIKFAPEGGRVEIWARHADGQSDVAIGVSDTGPGISKENREVIFERFRQGNQQLHATPQSDCFGTDHSATSKGFGLGLSIARKLVELNLGELNVNSNADRGSTFTFTLPLFDPRVVFERLLGRLAFMTRPPSNMSLLTVEIEGKRRNAAAVVDEFLHRAVRVSDLVMPGGNGSWIIAAACSEPDCERMIQQLTTEWADYKRNCPLATLRPLQFTYRGSWSIADQREDIAEAFVELYHLNHLNLSPMPTVLVVDDDREIIQCLSERLRSAGFQVLSASDGEEGLLTARAKHPDVIVLDVRMQNKDGLTVLRELRDDPAIKNTPIVMLSVAIHEQQRALTLGASFFVRKPYDAEDVLAAIESCLQEPVS